MVVEPIRDKKMVSKFLIYLKGTNERDFLLAKFQLNTGLRISDVVQVKVSDLLTEGGRFREYFTKSEQKTHKTTKIKLNDELKKTIKSYIEVFKLRNDDYLFASRKGGCISTTQAYRVLKAAADALGIEHFGTHSLRKTFGYWTYKESKYNIGLIMDIFNHTSQSMTLLYIGINQEQKDKLYSVVSF
ncbi:tyrosine-type recombinase/integrase [Proteiniclasticum sp. SCR006]|uniref:Tyrosine-type recombinase/integrase n=1 Tax=Proteiniclasticum aestuarii TaxID=2817862 RepID=A0A939H9M6_9CLOT|nr:tyrosine-type recombinase/integrase [Proteiniclasticum aestuarii]MBO1264498.1 tyrosine-type recombinase/integrase [Proteiniclasticum aestuarii]